jgi:C1q domain
MGIDLAGTTLTASAGLIATYSGSQIMKMGSTGILQRYLPAQPMFRAGGSGANAWIVFAAANTWYPIVYNATNVNIGSCYNTSNGRFTAPVTGIYLIVAHTYYHGNSAGWYVHPMYWVNGSATARRPSGGGLHRMRGHGSASGYEEDTDSFEIMTLVAGDYVEFYNFGGGGPNQWLPQYSRYEGYLLG